MIILTYLLTYSLVLADTTASALLAPTAHSLVLADATASALLTSAVLPPVLADLAASALLAPTALPPVLADGAPPGPLRGWLHRPLCLVGAIHHFVITS